MEFKQGDINNENDNNNKTGVAIEKKSLVLDDGNIRESQIKIGRNAESINIKEDLDLSYVEVRAIGLSDQEFIEIEDTLKALEKNKKDDYLSISENGRNYNNINGFEVISDSDKNGNLNNLELVNYINGRDDKDIKQQENNTNKDLSSNPSQTEKSSETKNNYSSESKSQNKTESIKYLYT